MKFQVWKFPVLCLLFCYWSSTSTVTGFTTDQLKRITDYVKETYGIKKQYAYVITFDKTECEQLTDQNIKDALKNDKANDVRNKVLSHTSEIYEGSRMVMASYKELGNNQREHSEHRLLYPAPDSTVSPVENLLNKAPTECAIFFTLNSPCQAYCTKPNGPYEIVSKLDQFSKINNRAFVYDQVYNDKICFAKCMESVDKKMPVYRCDKTCFECFTNGKFNLVCLNSSYQTYQIESSQTEKNNF
ncbi:Hypothetical predicted protein [Pelobates cultripes]|uniref:Uncharacterized protein n=1 Tax=Pelobates cultripes TaxID=61616 RepID=A0AAD1VQ13_PELCU|nr:Hypothetical predicted protein [Pelobates cultripes]